MFCLHDFGIILSINTVFQIQSYSCWFIVHRPHIVKTDNVISGDSSSKHESPTCDIVALDENFFKRVCNLKRDDKILEGIIHLNQNI